MWIAPCPLHRHLCAMTQYSIHTRQGLPEVWQTLLRDYPREAWPDHPNFTRPIRKWMGAHVNFRQMAGLLRGQSKEMMDKTLDPARFQANLGHYGHALVQHLHGHHAWEDHRFFPELAGAAPRFIRGLDMLETDHTEMDALLERFSRAGNRYLQLMQMSPDDAPQELPDLMQQSQALEQFLNRHLTDEEDLVVPILLHHKMRG